MNKVYPLVFEPIFKQRIWGDRSLERLLGKNLPDNVKIGESWELADLPSDVSVVANGPEKGRSLHDLVDQWGKDLLGEAAPYKGRFPLLIKFLDAKDVLSVQVHPDTEAAKELGPDVQPKYEAWYVIDAEPGAVIYCGLKPGVTKEQLAAASEDGTVGELLQKYEAGKGDAFYLPAGTVHAIGAGLVLAEPQTPSDVTYRLFDWNRVDPKTGKGRELHLEKGIRVTRPAYTTKDIIQDRKELSGFDPAKATRLVVCEAFVIDRFEMAAGGRMPVPGGQLAVWMMLAGWGRIRQAGGDEQVVTCGQTALQPAALGDSEFEAESDCMWLRVSVPENGDSPA